MENSDYLLDGNIASILVEGNVLELCGHDSGQVSKLF